MINKERFTRLGSDVFDRDCYVIYSGGADSTVLLDQVAYAVSKTKNGKVYALSWNYPMFSEKRFMIEHRCRSKFIEHLQEEFGKDRINAIEAEMKVNLFDGSAYLLQRNDSGHPQALFYLLASITAINDNASLFFGIIRNDMRYLMNLPELEKLLEAYKILSIKPNMQVHVPLITSPKEDNLQYLFANDIYKYIWYCEGDYKSYINDTIEDYEKVLPCRTCRSCTTHFNALISLALSGRCPKAIDALKDEFDFDFATAVGGRNSLSGSNMVVNQNLSWRDDMDEPDFSIAWLQK